MTEIRGAGQGCFAGRISSLNLHRNNLVGNFTIAELGDLANLTYIDLSWNNISGAIPTEVPPAIPPRSRRDRAEITYSRYLRTYSRDTH